MIQLITALDQQRWSSLQMNRSRHRHQGPKLGNQPGLLPRTTGLIDQPLQQQRQAIGDLKQAVEFPHRRVSPLSQPNRQHPASDAQLARQDIIPINRLETIWLQPTQPQRHGRHPTDR